MSQIEDGGANVVRYSTTSKTYLDARRNSSSSDMPSPFMDIKLHQAIVSHFQQEGLARFLICDVGTFHDLVRLERLLSKGNQDLVSFIQHSGNSDTHQAR